MEFESLRIAFATPEYVTEKYFDGGLGNYIHRVAKALAELGHDVQVLTLSEIDETDFEHEGVTVHRLKRSKWWSRLNRATRTPLPSTLGSLDFSVKVHRKLKQLNSIRPLQLVQFPNYSSCGLFSILFLPVPHVLRASSYQPALNKAVGVVPTIDSRLVKRLESLQFRLSRHIFAPSHKLQNMLAAEAGLASVQLIRSPFYLETPEWDHSIYERYLKGKKYLLFFGRFQLHKGFHILAHALPRVLQQHPDACVVLVGRDMQTRLAPSMADYARAQCNGFAERLVMLESLSHSQLYPVIAGAHLVVLPSLIENLPNACMEAMGLGKAVVGTERTSFDELISDGVTGFLVPPNDAEALAEKIICAWTDPKLEKIGAAAHQRMTEFAPEETIGKLVSYYREVVVESAADS